jgi:hypothetical protein
MRNNGTLTPTLTLSVVCVDASTSQAQMSTNKRVVHVAASRAFHVTRR